MRNIFLLILTLLIASCGESSYPPQPNPYIDDFKYDSNNPGNIVYPANCDGTVQSIPEATSTLAGTIKYLKTITLVDSYSFTVIKLSADVGDASVELSRVCIPSIPQNPFSYTVNYIPVITGQTWDYILDFDIYYKQPNGFYAYYGGYYSFTGIPNTLDVTF